MRHNGRDARKPSCITMRNPWNVISIKFPGVKDNSSSGPETHGLNGKIIPGIVFQILKNNLMSFQRSSAGETNDGSALDVVV